MDMNGSKHILGYHRPELKNLKFYAEIYRTKPWMKKKIILCVISLPIVKTEYYKMICQS